MTKTTKISPAPLISIITPAMNEEHNLKPLYYELKKIFMTKPGEWNYEIIIVNDGSTDNTWQVIEELASIDSKVKGIHFARNFGHQSALLAGLEHAKGDAVITIDADLEQPPSSILKMLKKWEEGFQVVHSVRTDHPDTSYFKKTSSKYFYKVFAFLSKIPIKPGMLDFRLMDRKVVLAILSMPETDFFLRGISAWIGFKQTQIPYQAQKRQTGKTKYSITKMISFALRGITSFSTFPLRLATYLGALMTLLSLLFGTYTAVRYFFWTHPNPGYASIITTISFLMGIQFLLLGLLGEYIARIHVEVKRRPRYFVSHISENKNLNNTVELKINKQ